MDFFLGVQLHFTIDHILFYQKYLLMGIANNSTWINLDSMTKIAELE